MLSAVESYLLPELAQVVISYVPVDVVIAATDTALLYMSEQHLYFNYGALYVVRDRDQDIYSTRFSQPRSTIHPTY